MFEVQLTRSFLASELELPVEPVESGDEQPEMTIPTEAMSVKMDTDRVPLVFMLLLLLKLIFLTNQNIQ